MGTQRRIKRVLPPGNAIDGRMARLTVIPGGRTDVQRFEVLVRPHYDALYRAAYRLTRSTHDAEDLVQEVCVRAYPRLEELATLDNPRAWLLRVMQRIFIDQARRYERSHVEPLGDDVERSLASGEPEPSDRAEEALLRARLDRAWQRLSKEHRALLALHDIEGYSLAELTELTGLKEGTLKSRLHRARVKLGKLLRAVESRAARQVDFGAAS
jgi:RNA polymerase sigma-70 factor (ECF subfamily)